MMKKPGVYAAVVGGGASGLICALRIAERYPDRSVVIIEKADRVGKKLLVTGNGRCNLSHLGASAENYHGEGSEAIINILNKKYRTEVVLAYFETLGLSWYADGEGRVYPRSNAANSVLDVLRLRLDELAVEERCGVTVTEITQRHGGYRITTDSGAIETQKLVIATGGKTDYAGRESGSTALLKTLGLPTAKPTPSLSPVKVSSDLLKPLKGVRAAAKVSLIQGEKVIKERRGEVQFADGALSGICIFDLAREANRSGGEINIAFLPDLDDAEVEEQLKRRAAYHHNGETSRIFTGLFHKSVALALLKSAGISPSTAIEQLTDEKLKTLAYQVNHLRFTAQPRYDFKNAQVTAGGVRLSEIDPATFEAKRRPGLYIIGEALDIDGDCGGYNLQFAFASGLCAGDSL